MAMSLSVASRIRCCCLGVALLLAGLAPPEASALSPAARYSERDRFQCPDLGIANCTANNGLAFFDGCRVVACIGWRSAVLDPRQCRPATRPDELARCQRLNDRLEILQGNTVGGNSDALITCPQFAGIDFCHSADAFYSYHDGCNYHLCDGSGGSLERTENTCPTAASADHLFFCASNYNNIVRQHNSRHACKEQMNAAERICEAMWPGYRFGDPCYGGNDFVCGPGGRLLLRPPARLCPLADASESVKCREVARDVSDILSETRGFTCPELQFTAVCTEENRGFIYNDGCQLVLCDGDGTGLTEGRVCKLPFDESQPSGRRFCEGQTAAIERRVAASRRHTSPCLTPAEACAGPETEGESYFNGCNFCTCLGPGRAQCLKRPCAGFYGSYDEFTAYCASAAYRLG